ncbi:MAG: hypothetical protein V3T95_01530 [Acidobacteriota bacterium]
MNPWDELSPTEKTATKIKPVAAAGEYVNPWAEPSWPGDGDAPRSRRKAAKPEPAPQPVVSKPAVEKKPVETVEEGKTAPDSAELPEREPDSRESPMETVTDWIIDSFGKGKEKPIDVPVEDLVNGIINTLGEGLAIVINTGLSAGSAIKFGVCNGATAVIFGARDGFWVACEFVGKLSRKVVKRPEPGNPP